MAWVDNYSVENVLRVEYCISRTQYAGLNTQYAIIFIMIEHTSVSELKTILDSKTNCHIIDVREIPEYDSVRIPNSVLVSLSTFNENMNLIDKNTSNYFLCGIGKRALKAAEYLATLGYKNLYVIDGGIKAWIEAGYPVECG